MTKNELNAVLYWGRFDSLLEGVARQLKDVSQSCDIPYASIVGWRAKHKIPGVEACVSIARYLGTTVDFMLTGEENEAHSSSIQINARYRVTAKLETHKAMVAVVKAQEGSIELDTPPKELLDFIEAK